MSSFLQEITEGKIDFAGQQLVEMISKITLSLAGAVAFSIGLAMQDIRITFAVMGFAIVVLALVVIPPWPMFNRYPVKWLPVADKKSKIQ